MDLAVQVHTLTRTFPRDELFGLTSQLRRASQSVPLNLAEGQGRDTPMELRHFVRIARGSLAETETGLELGRRLGYVSPDDYETVMLATQRVARVLNGLLRSLSGKAPG
ncbi:MAG: four helix bundle protein [Dehalococcoidia bacterium]|nr:four helix bundle protein [Dehalococcoidia bacterium]